MFLFSFHAHTLMRDLKTLFVFVVFFFLGLKNFISPLFCWTVAKKKTATHTPIFVWMNCADDGCWKNTSHMMQNLTMYCFNKNIAIHVWLACTIHLYLLVSQYVLAWEFIFSTKKKLLLLLQHLKSLFINRKSAKQL